MDKRLVILLFIFLSTISFAQSADCEKFLDSLDEALKKAPNDYTKVDIYEEICYENFSHKDINLKILNKSDSINKIIFQLSKKFNYKLGFGFYYENLAKIYFKKEDKDNTIKYAILAEEIFLKEEKKEFYFENISFLAETYIGVNKFREAKKILLKSLKSKDLDDYLKTVFYEKMSRICYKENSLYKALFYLKKSFKYNNNKDKGLLKNTYDALANINIDFSKFSQANYYLNLYYGIVKDDPDGLHYYYIMKSEILQRNKKYEESLKICLNNEIYYQTLDNYNTKLNYILNKKQLCLNYYHLKMYDKAIVNSEYLLNSVKLNSFYRATTSSFLGLLYNIIGKNKKANYYIDKALQDVAYIDNPIEKSTIFKNKSIIAKSSHDYATALEYSDKSAVLIQEYYKQREQEDAFNALDDMEDNEKESRIKQLKIAALEKTVEIDRQRNYLIFILLGLAVAITSILVYRKLYGSIKKRNNIIENRNQELLISQNIIQNALQEKEVLVKEIHHRVKNNLQLVMSLLNMQLRHNKEVDIVDFVKTSQSRISSIALLYEQLYQQKSEGEVNFKEYVTALSSTIVTTYSDLQDQVSLDIEIPTVNFDLETATPLGLIICEFINNSFKHAFPSGQKGIIFLKLNKLKGNKHELNISDNGVGLAEGYLDKNTLGIQLVNLLVAQIKGVIAIQNSGGASYSIQF
jgi:two-component system, sensor histidine kinase PdtaS